jgi:DNA gyrase subunit B
MLARAELIHRADFASAPPAAGEDAETALREVPAKLAVLHADLVERADEFDIKIGDPIEDEEHHAWSIVFTDSQGAVRPINWTLASSPEFRQMMAKYSLIKEFLEPPFLIEYATKAAVTTEEAEEAIEAPESAEAQAEAKSARRSSRALREPVEKQTARELFTHIVEQGKKDYSVQRYKGLGEMTATQLWETTMDPEHRTLLSVKLEDIAECEAIFTTLMGEDVEARRKFIEDNALDVKNLDI